MAGQNDKMSPGQDLDMAINHQVWNDLVDLRMDKRRAHGQRVRPANPHDLPYPTDVIKIKNDTGGALRLGEIVEIQDKTLTGVKRAYPWLDADTPDETKPFAICLHAIADGKIGLAQIAGCCPALINVGATTDLWAYVSSGADVLVGDRFWGDVRLMHTPGSTGEQLLWVSFEKSPQEWIGKADGDIDVDATGTVSVWDGDTPSDTTFNIANCLNWTGVDITSGARVTVRRIGRKPRVFMEDCAS